MGNMRQYLHALIRAFLTGFDLLLQTFDHYVDFIISFWFYINAWENWISSNFVAVDFKWFRFHQMDMKIEMHFATQRDFIVYFCQMIGLHLRLFASYCRICRPKWIAFVKWLLVLLYSGAFKTKESSFNNFNGNSFERRQQLIRINILMCKSAQTSETLKRERVRKSRRMESHCIYYI